MTDILDLIKSGLGGVTLTVTADDLANLVAKSIEAAKAELLPILASQTEEALLTREEVREKFGVCYGTLWNWSKEKILVPIKIGRKVRYKFSDVSRVISEPASKGNIDTSFSNLYILLCGLTCSRAIIPHNF